ncbi:transglycosylase domain-containing protein [Luteococcus peritonei]|uniref:Transglycosylase domain-containing protein n=1 Tax=Luteococcus peritonei TaxID=88874 RepID=A0ABW4RVH6_9ACTN
MTPRTSGSNAYHLGLFAALSVVCGLLVAGLLLPFAAVGGSLVKSSANSLESLPAELAIGPQSERSRVLMADGSVLTEFYAENRVYVPLKQISPLMRTAQTAIEDSRFYEHGAIDFRGTARAALRSASGSTQGGSTLTQQYVKQVQIEAANVANDEEGVLKAQEQTLARKVRELRYAVAVEKKLSKDQILERYLNIAYYGAGAYGVEAAAHRYFNTSAAKLTLPQAAMLAGLVQNPVATDPIHNPNTAIQRRNVVLNRMLELKLITKAQADAAKKTGFDAKLVQQPKNDCVDSQFPTLCLYVKNVMTSDQFKVLGKTRQERLNTLQRGGLTIRTLINPKAQTAAEAAVAGRIAPTDPFISTSVMIQPKSGLIVAMAQNRPKLGNGKGQTWYNYSVDAGLGGAEGYQAGSTFKTFTIAAAIANGISISRSYNSPQTMQFKGQTFRSCKGPFTAGDYKPKNSTGAGHFNMTQATMKSINTYFVQLERDAGLCNVVKMSQAAGVKRADGKDLIKDSPYYDNIISYTLGAVEVTPLSMAEAYATFANRGVHCNPIIVESVTNKAGKKVAVPSADCKKVMEPYVADTVSLLLQKTIGPGGTANPANLGDGRDQAAKTGTIDSAEAVWLAGYTPELAGIAMIAADKQAPQYKGKKRRSITGRFSHGTECVAYGGCQLSGSGGRDAGKIWRRAMRAGVADLPRTQFHSPSQEAIQGKYQEIPDTSGMTWKDREAALQAAGFSVQYTQEYNSAPAGTMLYYYPTSGRRRTGDPIYFVTSMGPRPAPKPTATRTRTATSQPRATATRSSTKPTATKTTTKASPKPTATKTTAQPKPSATASSKKTP